MKVLRAKVRRIKLKRVSMVKDRISNLVLYAY